MEKEEKINSFIIERLDLNKESNSSSNIYDLSILDHIKEKKSKKRNKNKQYFKKFIKTENTKKISLEKKTLILRVVKKAILSSNSFNKSNLMTVKKLLLFINLYCFISTITQNIYDTKESNSLNQTINGTNFSFNMKNSSNNSISNITNNDGFIFYFFNNTLFDSLINNTTFQNIVNFTSNMRQIIFLLFWFFYCYKLIPNWDKINDTLHKITSHLLLCESKENNNYNFNLMKDFSILVTKKESYSSNKKLLPIVPEKNESLSDKNIILYCISIIDNYICEKSITIKNRKLISNDDYHYIKVLKLYIEKSSQEIIKKYHKKLLIPFVISMIITIVYYNPEYEYLIYFLTFILIILSEFIFLQYIQSSDLNIDYFIEIYNCLLIKENRLIYKKNQLIMYFALRNNNYSKNQIINFIEEIINS